MVPACTMYIIVQFSRRVTFSRIAWILLRWNKLNISYTCSLFKFPHSNLSNTCIDKIGILTTKIMEKNCWERKSDCLRTFRSRNSQNKCHFRNNILYCMCPVMVCASCCAGVNCLKQIPDFDYQEQIIGSRLNYSCSCRYSKGKLPIIYVWRSVSI